VVSDGRTTIENAWSVDPFCFHCHCVLLPLTDRAATLDIATVAGHFVVESKRFGLGLSIGIRNLGILRIGIREFVQTTTGG